MFGFPTKKREDDFQYKRNFLRTVIFRIDYARSKSVVDNIEVFKNKLQDNFPNTNEILNTETTLRFENKTPIFEPQSSLIEGIELKSKDLQKSLKITDTFIAYAIEGGVYGNFENEFDIVKEVIETAQKESVDIEFVNRIAIRKINIIDFSIPNGVLIIDAVSSMFNNVLNKSLTELPRERTASNYNQSIGYTNIPYRLNFNYGYRQGTDNNWSALLDIDIFRNVENTQETIEIHQTEKEFIKINNEIFNIFHWSLQDNLLNELNKP